MRATYDVIVVGAGPSGLAVAQGCARHGGLRVLVVDKEATVGGCHRVRRVNGGLFTEHGPRIYSTNHRTLSVFLRDAGIVESQFRPARVQIPMGLAQLDLWSMVCMAATTAWTTTVWPDHGKSESMAHYCARHGFSPRARDAVDRICRLTDGAGAERYTVFEFFNLVHQHAFYRVTEPRQPTDTGLLAEWRSALEATGLVEFRLGCSVTRVDARDAGGVVTLRTQAAGRAEGVEELAADRVVLAVPPESMVAVLRRCGSPVSTAFGPLDMLDAWSHATSYQDYVSFTMHFGASDASAVDAATRTSPSPTAWGVAGVPLSRFMPFVDLGKPGVPVLSCIVTRLDARSLETGLTANETRDRDALLREAVRQVREMYPGLPQPSVALLSPGAFLNAHGESPSSHWDDVDTAFVRTPGAAFLPQQSPSVPWLWNVGCHNGFQKYQFTSIEAATSNAAALLHAWFPASRQAYPILAPFELRDALRIGCFAVALVLVGSAVVLLLRMVGGSVANAAAPRRRRVARRPGPGR
jgi:glycine/D-amino acid oxidase-like deaminating enzyme